MIKHTLCTGSSLLLSTLLLGGCPPPAEQPPAGTPPVPEEPSPPVCRSCTSPEPRDPAAPREMPDGEKPDMMPPDLPLFGKVLLLHSRVEVIGFEATHWALDATLSEPPERPASVSMIGECRRTDNGGPAGRALDAGDLTIAGAPYGARVLAWKPLTRTYEAVEDEEDATDGALFRASSRLEISASGGADIQGITQQGTWRGVELLQISQPRTLDTLPRNELRLSWVAAPRADAKVEVSLVSPTMRVDCPVSEDRGAYTVGKPVLDALPAGPIHLFVSRYSRAQATTTPNHGVVLLESRSRWQIITRK